MWVLAMAVLVPVFYILSGRPLPVDVIDQLDKYFPDDVAPTKQLVAIGCIVGVLIASSPLHKVVRYLPTVVHELGHAFTAGVLGGRPKNITISLDASGLAEYQPPLSWGRFRGTLVSLAGYPAPSIAALAAVMVTQDGHPQAWLTFAVGTLAISIVLLIRNLWGFVWTLAVVGGSFYGAPYVPAELNGALVSGVAGYLAVEAYRHAFLQWMIIRKFPGSGSDAEKVARAWRMNAPFIGFLHLVSVAIIGGYAVYLAVSPYWSEIFTWTEDIIRTT